MRALVKIIRVMKVNAERDLMTFLTAVKRTCGINGVADVHVRLPDRAPENTAPDFLTRPLVSMPSSLPLVKCNKEASCKQVH